MCPVGLITNSTTKRGAEIGCVFKYGSQHRRTAPIRLLTTSRITCLGRNPTGCGKLLPGGLSNGFARRGGDSRAATSIAGSGRNISGVGAGPTEVSARGSFAACGTAVPERPHDAIQPTREITRAARPSVTNQGLSRWSLLRSPFQFSSS
jgi:hypothetical protein